MGSGAAEGALASNTQSGTLTDMFVAPPPSVRREEVGDPNSRATSERRRVVVATDGSSLGNPGPGGWGWYVDDTRWAAGAVPGATNNQMELEAIAQALEAIPEEYDLEIQADSAYSIDALTKWIHGWRRRGWTTSSGGDVANRALIERIDSLLTERRRRGGVVDFTHVKGHAGHELNEAVDSKARGASEALKAGMAPATGPGWSETTDPETTESETESAAGPEEKWRGQGSLFGL